MITATVNICLTRLENISYDGKTLLKYDDKTGECTPIKMKSASSNQSEPAGETHTHENGEVHSGAVHGE